MDVLKLKYIVPCRYVRTVDDGDDTGVGIVACDVGVEVVAAHRAETDVRRLLLVLEHRLRRLVEGLQH